MEQQTFPVVTLPGDGILLRPFRPADAPDVAAACTDPVTQTWLPLPNPYTLESAQFYVTEFSEQTLTSGGGIVFCVEKDRRLAAAIDLKHTDWRGLTTEIGYWTAPWARGQGVMTEAVRVLSRWALLEQGFERVEIRAATGNVASRRVAEKAGFTAEGVLRNAGYVHGGRVDLTVLSLVPADLALLG